MLNIPRSGKIWYYIHKGTEIIPRQINHHCNMVELDRYKNYKEKDELMILPDNTTLRNKHFFLLE